MMQPTRRGLLGGLVTLLAAPAIIKIEALMPISRYGLPTYGPNGFLTMPMITKEMAWVLAFMDTAAEETRAVTGQLSVESMMKQHEALDHSHFVHTCLKSVDRLLSLEDYSERVLKPQAAMLKERLAGGRIAEDHPPVPVYGVYEAAGATVRGVGVRGVTAYNVITDSLVTRFDVAVA
jgi:hypothetical protein